VNANTCRSATELAHTIPGHLLGNIRELVFEHCMLDGADWDIACMAMTNLTKLQLEVKASLPEDIMGIDQFLDPENKSGQQRTQVVQSDLPHNRGKREFHWVSASSITENSAA